jgi:DNA-binding NtrC family response regulator
LPAARAAGGQVRPADGALDSGLGPNDADLLQKLFTSARMEFEKRYLTEALRKANGKVTRAAEESGEYRKKMARLIKKHGVEVKARADSGSGRMESN